MHSAEPTDTRLASPTREIGTASGWLNAKRYVLLLGTLVFAAFPGVILGSRTFVFRDFGLFSYPVAFFARESFWEGQLPLWNPYSNCGLPFLAQWNTMVLYPPTLIYLLLPLSWSLPFFCLLHSFWGGLGMYFLARHWTGFKLAGGVAGIMFAFNGLNLNFLMWPSHVATFSWLPWVIWLGQDAWRTGGRKLVWAIAVGAMQMLAGGPETILVTWAILGLLAITDCFNKPTQPGRVVARFVGMALLVALVCSAQLLPFLQLLAHSQRDSGYGTLAQNWPMPPWGWASFLVPLFRASPTQQGVYFQPDQYWTSSYYAGVGTVWLALIALWRTRQGYVRLLACMISLCLLLSLGDAGVVYRIARSLIPGLAIVRYPIKFVIPVLALAPLLAAFGMAAVVCDRHRAARFEWVSGLVLALSIGAIILLSRNEPIELWRATWQNGLVRAAFLIATMLLVARIAKASGSSISQAHYSRFLFGGALLLVFYLDLTTHVPNQNPTASPTVYAPSLTRAQLHWNPGPTLGVSRAMLAPNAQDALKYRAISDPEKNYLLQRVGLLADCNLIESIPQVHGFFSLTPGDINDVTVVPYVQTNRDFARMLDFMGVSQVTTANFESKERSTAMPLVTAGQKPIFAEDRTTFEVLGQTNIDLSRTVFLPTNARAAISTNEQIEARIFDPNFTNARVSFGITTPAPTWAVISQTYYPAWKAYVDGKPVPIWRANYAFQAVPVPPGTHRIELKYEDSMFRLGMILSFVGILFVLVLWVSHRTPRAQTVAG